MFWKYTGTIVRTDFNDFDNFLLRPKFNRFVDFKYSRKAVFFSTFLSRERNKQPHAKLSLEKNKCMLNIRCYQTILQIKRGVFMKFLLITIAFLSSFQLLAQDIGTADNMDYLVTFKDNASFKKCYTQVKRIAKNDGHPNVQIIAQEMGIINANLTSAGANQVAQLECILAVELNGEVAANPRLGRNN